MKYFIILSLFIIGCKDNAIELNSEPKTICTVKRENDIPLSCKRCIKLGNDLVHIETLTGYKMKVHISRVHWFNQRNIHEDKILQKPFKLESK